MGASGPSYAVVFSAVSAAWARDAPFADMHSNNTHARRVNLTRRHLSQEQRRQLVADELRGDPSRSDRQIAAGFCVDHKTVGAARDRLGGTGEIPQLEKTTGTDGKARPVNRQHKRRLNSGIGKTTPSRDKKAGPSPMLDPRAWSLSTPQAREAFVREVGPRDIEAVIKAIRLNDQLPETSGAASQTGTMAQQFRRRAEEQPDRLLLYVDQWEELYAQASGTSRPEQRHRDDVERFVELLLSASRRSLRALGRRARSYPAHRGPDLRRTVSR
jgi:hypothetical protein